MKLLRNNFIGIMLGEIRFIGDCEWWISILEIEWNDFNGSLIHIEYNMGNWTFDFLYLRQLVIFLKGKYEDGKW